MAGDIGHTLKAHKMGHGAARETATLGTLSYVPNIEPASLAAQELRFGSQATQTTRAACPSGKSVPALCAPWPKSASPGLWHQASGRIEFVYKIKPMPCTSLRA